MRSGVRAGGRVSAPSLVLTGVSARICVLFFSKRFKLRIKFGPGHKMDPAFHLVVPPTTQFGANDIVLPLVPGFEPHALPHARNHILLESHVGQEKTVEHVGAGDTQQHLFVHRQVKIPIGADNVITRVQLVIWPGITEIPVELPPVTSTMGGISGIRILASAQASIW